MAKRSHPRQWPAGWAVHRRMDEEIRRMGMMRISEAARRVGASTRGLSDAVKRGDIPVVWVRCYRAVKLADVRAYWLWPEGMISVQEAAAKTKVPRARILWGIEHQRIPFVRFRRNLFAVKLEDVVEYGRLPEGYLRVSQAARQVGIPSFDLYRAISVGHVRSVQIRNQYAVKLTEVEAFHEKTRDLLRVSDAAAKARVSADRVYSGIERGFIPKVQLYKYWLVPLKAVRAYRRWPQGYWTIDAAARECGGDAKMAHGAVETGEIPCLRIAGVVGVKLPDMRAYQTPEDRTGFRQPNGSGSQMGQGSLIPDPCHDTQPVGG